MASGSYSRKVSARRSHGCPFALNTCQARRPFLEGPTPVDDLGLGPLSALH